MKNCASCGAPPSYDWISCRYCARPNLTHPHLAAYVDKEWARKEQQRPSPLPTRTPMMRATTLTDSRLYA